MTRRLFCVVAIIALPFSAPLYANSWYQVELIIFEQLTSETDEKWPLANDEITSPTLSLQKEGNYPPQNQALLTIVSRLQNSPATYRVHYHDTWQQVITTKRDAKAVQVRNNSGLIDGSIRLYISTYLYAEIDLWLKIGEAVNDEIRYPNLNELRRINKKLQFFDHPKMGALLKVTEIEASSLPSQEGTDLKQSPPLTDIRTE